MRTRNLNALRMFDAAARHLNFRLAAEELKLTQGAVAQQVRRLGAELGQVFFHRKARGLALTDIGRSYHAPVRRALAIIDEATRTLRPETARVTLSVTPSFAAKWLVPRLSRFEAAHPEIDLRTVASERIADFQPDGVDIAIRHGQPPFERGTHGTLLAPLDLCAVCSPGYAQSAAPIDRFEDFAAHRLIQDSHTFWETLFEHSGTTARHRFMQFNQTSLAMDAAANGQGVALAPRLLVADEIASGKLVLLWRDAGPDRSGYHIVHPIAAKPNPARNAVIAWILSEAGGTDDGHPPR
ncbi:MAG TPA: LysR substrate-binding domain-containing protein [Aurantimonas sp.]